MKCKAWNFGVLCLQTHSFTCLHDFSTHSPIHTHSLTHSWPESCVSAQLPSPACRKQETGVEVGVHSVINVSVSQRGRENVWWEKREREGEQEIESERKEKECRDIKLSELPLCSFFFFFTTLVPFYSRGNLSPSIISFALFCIWMPSHPSLPRLEFEQENASGCLATALGQSAFKFEGHHLGHSSTEKA